MDLPNRMFCLCVENRRRFSKSQGSLFKRIAFDFCSCTYSDRHSSVSRNTSTLQCNDDQYGIAGGTHVGGTEYVSTKSKAFSLSINARLDRRAVHSNISNLKVDLIE